MYFRVTTYGFDAGRRDEFLALADTVRDDMKAVQGLETVHSCETGEGQGMIVARYDSEASATAAQPTIQGIFAKMAQFMTSPPDVKGGTVIWEM